MPIDVYVEALLRAADTLGGLDALALELGVSPQVLSEWLGGVREPRLDTFLRAVDIVMDGNVRLADPDRVVTGNFFHRQNALPRAQ